MSPEWTKQPKHFAKGPRTCLAHGVYNGVGDKYDEADMSVE
jgi:hypothetical protein